MNDKIAKYFEEFQSHHLFVVMIDSPKKNLIIFENVIGLQHRLLILIFIKI